MGCSTSTAAVVSIQPPLKCDLLGSSPSTSTETPSSSPSSSFSSSPDSVVSSPRIQAESSPAELNKLTVRLILNFNYEQAPQTILRQENRAIEQFNSGEPWKAIETLGLEDKPKAAAEFLHGTPSLDMTILGEMLSEPKREELMRVYVERLDLKNLALDGALRRLLRGFRLPGEAQKIDRIMDAFAEHWLSCQADGGTAGPLTTDTAFLMSFALIMLNTDLHNPSVKRKMSLKQFQSNLRGVNAGQDLPKAFIKKLYNNVKREAFCLR